MRIFKKIITLFLILFFLLTGIIFITIAFYKNEIAHHITNQLKENYGLILKTEKINVSFFSNWPNASIQLKHAFIANASQLNEPLLKAESLSLSFDLKELFHKQFIVKSIAVKNAEINLIKNENGDKNFEFNIKKDSSKQQSNFKLEVNQITLKNVRIKFSNKQYHKKIEFNLIENLIKIKNYEDGLKADFIGDVFVIGLLFKPEKGAFLENSLVKLNLKTTVCFKRKEIFIHQPSYAEINKQYYKLSAFINLNEDKQLLLNITGNQVNYNKALSLLNSGVKNKLSTIKIQKPFDAKALILVRLGIQQEPIIILRAISANNAITIGDSKIPYSDVSFNASLISLDTSLTQGNSSHAKVILKNIKGKVYDFPFDASVIITSFLNSTIAIGANLHVDAKKIKFKIGKKFDLNGNINAHVNYSGPINNLNRNEFLNHEMKLNAAVNFVNLSYKQKSKPFKYLVNGSATATNNVLEFKNLILKTDGGNVSLKGNINNFVKFAVGDADGFKAQLSAYTDYFNVSAYLKPTDVENKKTKKTINVTPIKSVDSDDFEFDISLNAKKITVRNVITEHAIVKLHYKKNLISINSFNANTCGGKISAKATLFNLQKIDAQVYMNDIDVHQLFTQFDDFGQNAITKDNLKGNIFIDAKLKTELDKNMNILAPSLKGNIKLKLKNGHLLNYKPLENVSDYIFKNRDFNDISFTEINNTLLIDGYRVDIQEMEIASNVLNLFVSGKYNYKDVSSINLLIPWSNLKKRGKNYLPKNLDENDNKKGLKLNYSGMPKNLKLSLGHKTP